MLRGCCNVLSAGGPQHLHKGQAKCVRKGAVKKSAKKKVILRTHFRSENPIRISFTKMLVIRKLFTKQSLSSHLVTRKNQLSLHNQALGLNPKTTTL